MVEVGRARAPRSRRRGDTNMTAPTPAAVLTLSLYAYALMAVIAMLTAGLIGLLVAGLAASRRAGAVAVAVAEPAAAAPSAIKPAIDPAPDPAIDPAAVAAIAAAVRMTIGGHRIVWIGPTAPGAGWADELRRRHHESHDPRHRR